MGNDFSNNNELLVRSAKAYIREYYTRNLAISAVEQQMLEERVKIMPNPTRLKFLQKLKEYLIATKLEDLKSEVY